MDVVWKFSSSAAAAAAAAVSIRWSLYQMSVATDSAFTRAVYPIPVDVHRRLSLYDVMEERTERIFSKNLSFDNRVFLFSRIPRIVQDARRRNTVEKNEVDKKIAHFRSSIITSLLNYLHLSGIHRKCYHTRYLPVYFMACGALYYFNERKIWFGPLAK